MTAVLVVPGWVLVACLVFKWALIAYLAVAVALLLWDLREPVYRGRRMPRLRYAFLADTWIFSFGWPAVVFSLLLDWFEDWRYPVYVPNDCGAPDS
jgi:hypothetical protein